MILFDDIKKVTSTFNRIYASFPDWNTNIKGHNILKWDIYESTSSTTYASNVLYLTIQINDQFTVGIHLSIHKDSWDRDKLIHVTAYYGPHECSHYYNVIF